MQELSEKARMKARLLISSQFTDIDKLDDLGIKSFELERQLIAAESQLNSAVSSKLDSLKRAVDLMDESASKLNKLSTKISSIDEKISVTNTAISNYNHLKRVHNARENLNKVITQVEFFARVPERVTFLLQKLETYPECLKEVFLEAIKLESLRAALLKEMRLSRDRRSSTVAYVAPNSMSNTNEADESNHDVRFSGSYTSADGSYSIETFQKIRDAVENHLFYVPELINAIYQRIEKNLNDMFNLAANTPADLVTTFEVIEMQHEYNERRIKNGLLSSDTKNYSLEIQNKIRLMFYNIIMNEFNSINNNDESNNDLQNSIQMTSITCFLINANQILQKIIEFSTDVLPCIPPSYETLKIFIETFDEILLQKINFFIKDLLVLKVSEILDFINWIEYHAECMNKLNFNQIESLSQLLSIKTELLVEYKDRIKNQIMEWFNNIKKQEHEINQATNGTLVTSNPEDMFNIIHAQLSVAREKLPPDYCIEVAIACLQVLQHVQRETYDTLLKSWRSMDAQSMCSLINDNQRMKEKCDEFGNYVLRTISNPLEQDSIKAMLENVGREYVAIAVKAISSLTMCVLEDLDEQIFSKLYLPDWEQGEEIAQVLIVTLQDYFSDLSEWLYETFFRSFLKELLCSLIQRYIMFIRKKSNGIFMFQSQLMITKRISEDRIILLEFFEKYLEDLGLVQQSDQLNQALETNSDRIKTNSIDDSINCMNEFHILLSFAKIISAPYPSAVEGDIKYIMKKWGIDGYKCIIAVINCNPSQSKVEKTGHLELIKTWFDDGVASSLFLAKPMEVYKDFDIQQVNASGTKETKKPTRVNFWGRKK